MPVKFSEGTLLEMLLSTGYVMAGGKIRDDLLTNPTTLQKSGLGIGEAPSEIGNNSIVCRLLAKVVWVLEVKFLVGSSCSRYQKPHGT